MGFQKVNYFKFMLVDRKCVFYQIFVIIYFGFMFLVGLDDVLIEVICYFNRIYWYVSLCWE